MGPNINKCCELHFQFPISEMNVVTKLQCFSMIASFKLIDLFTLVLCTQQKSHPGI